MSKETTSSGGMGFLSTLTLIFVVLKLTDVIDWSWWWVFSPFWIGIPILLIFLVIVLVIVIFINALGD